MTAPATLTTTARGVTRRIYDLRVGHYVWHRGAFRRVTAISDDLRVVHMGRYALHLTTCSTVEAAA